MSWLKKLWAKLTGKKTDWGTQKYGNPPKVNEDDDQLRKLNGGL